MPRFSFAIAETDIDRATGLSPPPPSEEAGEEAAEGAAEGQAKAAAALAGKAARAAAEESETATTASAPTALARSTGRVRHKRFVVK